MKSNLLTCIFFGLVYIPCHGQPSPVIVHHHNKIDDINSIGEIEKLIASIDERYAGFKVNSPFKFEDGDCQRLCDSLEIKPFTKADIDDNGYTDLLVVGQWGDPAILCVMDSGEDRFFLKRIAAPDNKGCSLPKVSSGGNQTFFEDYYFKGPDRWEGDRTKKIISKKITYKFGGFIEYNPSVRDYHIQQVKFEATESSGPAPVFEIIINSDRTATYNAIKYNFPNGHFVGTVDPETYSGLISLLNYTDFPYLKEHYSVDWTDSQSCTLTIAFDNGNTKKIYCYGPAGTYGLGRVYGLIYKLRRDQAWK